MIPLRVLMFFIMLAAAANTAGMIWVLFLMVTR